MALAKIYNLIPLKLFNKIKLSNTRKFVFQPCEYFKPFLNTYNPRISLISSKMTVAEELGLPEPPKRPASPLIRYVSQEGKKITDLKIPDKIIKLSRQWGTLDESEKAKYTSEYTTELEIYREKYMNYLKCLTPDQIQEMKMLKEKRKSDKKIAKEKRKLRKEKEELGRPKHPGTPLTLFLETLREKKDFPSNNLMMKTIEEWQKLPEDKKDIYKEKYSFLMAQYKKELNVWETRMKMIGRPDLVRKGCITKI